MSKRKRASGADEIYATHLHGRFADNPETAREAVMERMYMRILGELATNRFKWSNMPESVDTRFLEMTLFYTALSVFYYDLRYDRYFSLRGGGTNWVNMLDNPTGFSVVGNNFVGMNLSAIRDTEKGRKAIPIWANYFRQPDLDIVKIYARKLANLDRTIEINTDNARQSKVLISSDNQRLSVENFNRQLTEGNNGIKVAGALGDMAFIQALDLGVNPDSFEKLHILRTRLWNECMGLLGIENANQDKKERLVEGEVEANDAQTASMRYVNLNARRMAVKKINAYYGTTISVDYYTEAERAEAIAESREAEINDPSDLERV